MSNIYQQLSLYFRQEQEVPLATEMAATEIAEIEETPPLTLQEKEVKIVASKAESEPSQRKEEIKNVLQSWLAEINKKEPVEGNFEAIREATGKLINSEAELSELSNINNNNNKFIFVENFENKLVKILAEEYTNHICISLINHKKIILYHRQRQLLLGSVDKLYKNFQIGRIWA